MASYRDFLPAVASGGGWQRPSDWLALPTVTSAEQKFVGLHAVFPEGNNFCAFLFRGAYTVDWGDGVVENVADNVKAEHVYDYSAISNATLTSRGYKQVIVTVTPQVGQNLTTINFQQRYTGQNVTYATGWLDVTGSFPNAGSGATITFGTSGVTTVRHSYLEQATILTIGACTSTNNFFLDCYNLQSVPLFNTALVTSMVSMFSACASLKSVPLFNTALVTNMGSMFFSCQSLLFVPLFNTTSVTSMSTMFQSCNSLNTIPLFNTTSVTNMSSMFQVANGIRNIPALSTASITTSFGDFANFANSLFRCEMSFAQNVSFRSTSMSRTSLVEVFNNLVDRSSTTSATIIVTNASGTSQLTAGDLLIATSKNWVITG
jgi:surface protein